MMENIIENRGKMKSPEETETVNLGFHRVIKLNGRGLCTLMNTAVGFRKTEFGQPLTDFIKTRLGKDSRFFMTCAYVRVLQCVCLWTFPQVLRTQIQVLLLVQQIFD